MSKDAFKTPTQLLTKQLFCFFEQKVIEKYLPVGESHQTHTEKLTKQRGSLLIKDNLMKKPHSSTK